MAQQTERKKYIWNLEDVNFSYHNGIRVLRNINLALSGGRIYGVLGPNGSGKTTLLDLLCGILSPDYGTVRFDGIPIKNFSARTLAKKVAMVPQEFRMRFSFTVREAVEMGMYPHVPRFSNITEEGMALIEEVMQQLDITTLADRPVTMLSGGEKQRVAAARALVQAGDALLLDEATSSLDIYHSLSILDVIRQRAREQGLVIVAAVHDINLAAFFCDEFIFLYKGAVAAKGTPEETLDAGLLRRIYGVEADVGYNNFTDRPMVNFRMPEDGAV